MKKEHNTTNNKSSSSIHRSLIGAYEVGSSLSVLNGDSCRDECRWGLYGGYISRLNELQSPLLPLPTTPRKKVPYSFSHDFGDGKCFGLIDKDSIPEDSRTISTSSLTVDDDEDDDDDDEEDEEEEDEDDLMESIHSNEWEEFLDDDCDLDEILSDHFSDYDDDDFEALNAILDGHDTSGITPPRTFLDHKDSFRVALDTKDKKEPQPPSTSSQQQEEQQQLHQEHEQRPPRRQSCPSLGESDLTPTHKQRKASLVSFASVEIREYGLTLGDHPECRTGPPLALDWEYQTLGKHGIDEYEQSRIRVKDRSELLVNASHRKNLLRNIGGHSEQEIQKAVRQARKIRRQRKHTETLSKMGDTMEQMTTRARRRLLSVVIGKDNDNTTTSNTTKKNKRQQQQQESQRKQDFLAQPLRQMYWNEKDCHLSSSSLPTMRAPSA